MGCNWLFKRPILLQASDKEWFCENEEVFVDEMICSDSGNDQRVPMGYKPQLHGKSVKISDSWWFMQPLREECSVMDGLYPPHGLAELCPILNERKFGVSLHQHASGKTLLRIRS